MKNAKNPRYSVSRRNNLKSLFVGHLEDKKAKESQHFSRMFKGNLDAICRFKYHFYFQAYHLEFLEKLLRTKIKQNNQND